jgi:hypothetical protein
VRAIALCLVGAGCAPICPSNARADAARLARLTALAEEQVRAPVCFTPGIGRGTTDGKRISLDALGTDAELSAELAHLVVHLRDHLGDGCALGREAALRSERAALEVEGRVRARLRLPVVDAAAAISDYQRRCAAAP